MEGVQLYAMLVEVFEAEKSRVKWYYCGGYGEPLFDVVRRTCGFGGVCLRAHLNRQFDKVGSDGAQFKSGISCMC